ncbi:hypothetical protein FBU30_009340 [Linnemannia zychae]|nr:hypothetical protein FBU30_009340 [Linnemannia zychae]
MDRLSNLPLECMEHILQYILQDNDPSIIKATLGALICTSKHLALITAPFLYSNPFRFTTHRVDYFSGQKHVRVTSPILTEMLLDHIDSVYAPDIPTVVRLAYGLKINTKQNQPPHPALTSATTFRLDYSTYLQHLDVEWATSGNYQDPPWIKYPSDIKKYLRGEEYEKLCFLDQLLDSFKSYYGNVHIISWCLWHILRREVTWVIAQPIMEQLRSLVIPVMDIKRYMDNLVRLSQLEHIRFSLDEPLDYDAEFDMAMTEEFASTNRRRKEMSMALIVDFVGKHTRLFEGCLQTVIVTNGVCHHFEKQVCPEETLVEIARHLPVLQLPLCLDERNWPGFIANSRKINLGAVKRIVFPPDPQPWFKILRENRDFLKRCRKLDKIKMVTLGQGTFSWAVQEKQALDRLVAFNMITASKNNLKSLSQGEEKEYRLIPVRSVTISAFSTIFADEIDDIAIGFSKTLQRLSVDVSVPDIMLTYPLDAITIGKGWVELPVLRKLSLNSNNARLIIHHQLLVHCPNVVTVIIDDPTSQYRCQDIEPCLPGHNPHLETLMLTGWSSLTFNPATLDSTSKLCKLALTMCKNDGYHFIPPVQELIQSYGDQEQGTIGEVTDGTIRPYWSWDWNLPLLTHLTLTSEFAYRFHFRMLHKCPSLEELTLDMLNSRNDTHVRILSKLDLFVSSNLNSNNSQKDNRIVLSKMSLFHLMGHWVIDDDLLCEFLGGMFPNLRYFNVKTMGGIAFEGIVKTLRTLQGTASEAIKSHRMPRMEEASLSRLETVKIDTNPFGNSSYLECERLQAEWGVYPLFMYRKHANLKTLRILKARICPMRDRGVLADHGYVVLQEPIQ